MEPGMARTVAVCPGLAARASRGGVRGKGASTPEGSVARQGRLYFGCAGPVRRLGLGVFCRSGGPAAQRAGTGRGAQASGTAAARDADVYQLRVVLRRAVRPGNGA